MAQLNILGAQRVKALTEMLSEIEKQAIKELQVSQKNSHEIKDIVDAEFNVSGLKEEARELEMKLRATLDAINAITGGQKYLSINTGYTNSRAVQTEWRKRYNELEDKNKKEIKELKEEFDNKKRKLWLCETLEEAKQLVGIE